MQSMPLLNCFYGSFYAQNQMNLAFVGRKITANSCQQISLNLYYKLNDKQEKLCYDNTIRQTKLIHRKETEP